MTRRFLGWCVLAAGLAACAVGDNGTKSNSSGWPVGPTGNSSGDDAASDDDDDGDDGDGAGGSESGAAESGEGGFPMPEPDDDPSDTTGPPPPQGDDSGDSGPPPPPPPGDCCTATMTPGCANDPAVEACVCQQDDFCCTEEWDPQCVSLVALCDDACPGAPPPPEEGDACCEPTGALGCPDPFAAACVCSLDEVCCFEGWDDICVEIATEECGVC